MGPTRRAPELGRVSAPRPRLAGRSEKARRGSARAIAIVEVLAIGCVLATLAAASAAGASPAPSGAPSGSPDEGGGLGNIEVWLDHPLPPDARAGSTLPIGMMIWDTASGRLSDMGGLYFRLHPATGKAKPTSTETRSDWPGHSLANVIVPRGGPGDVEVGITGQECRSDGTCTTRSFPFRIAGSGPPPGAPRSRLVTAFVHVPTTQVSTGQSIDVGVDVSPRVDWDDDALGLADRMIVVATLRDHPDLATTELHAEPSSPRAYRGAITIPDAGDVTLVFAFPVNGDADDVIAEATTRVRVVGDAAPGSVTPTTGGKPGAPAGDQPPWLLIGALLALVVVAGIVIRSVFADL